MASTDDFHGEEKIVVYIDADLEDLIPGFMENRRKDIQAMTGALDRQDYPTVQNLGHSMKGVGGGYGFDVITDIGRSIEEAAKAQSADDIRRWIDALASYLDRVEIVYEEE